MTTPKVTTIGVQLPVEMAEALREKAQESERTLSAEVRLALRAHLDPDTKAVA